MFSSSQTFEPRVATAQSIFCILYLIITVISLALAFYVHQTGEKPYFQLFMAVLFALMAIKSYIMAARIKKLLKEGVYYEATVESCEGVRGITTIKGTCDVENFGLIHIESRLVGERIAEEINRFLKKNKQKKLPALVVGATGKYPRGMFTIKSQNGHLLEESAMLKADYEKYQAQEQAKQAEFEAEIEQIAKKEEAKKAQNEQEKANEQEQANEQVAKQNNDKIENSQDKTTSDSVEQVDESNKAQVSDESIMQAFAKDKQNDKK